MKIQEWIDRIASIGALITAFVMSCCLPLFAIAGAGLGLSFIESESPIIPVILQGLYLLALVGGFLTYRKHKNVLPLFFIITGNFFIFFAYYFSFRPIYIYIALVALIAGSVSNFLANRNCGCQDTTN